MEEMEVPTEHLQEHINEEAHHAPSKWIMGVALTSAIFAALAAISSLLAGHYVNEAMIEQIQSSNHWAYYQSKSIKSSVLRSKIDLLAALNKPASEKDEEKVKEYQKNQDEIKDEAEEKEHESTAHLQKHIVLARAVTLFQIGIAIAAISVLVRRRRYWYGSLVLGAAGAAFLIQGIFFA
jgi:LPS O-antigen subunit length determinant protein (WzzB/FepE family)